MRNANPAFLTCSYSSVGYISNIAGASAGLANRWQKPGDEAYTNVPKAVLPKVVCQHLLCIVLILF